MCKFDAVHDGFARLCSCYYIRDFLTKKVKNALLGEKDVTVEIAEEYVTKLKQRAEFDQLSASAKEEVLLPFNEVLNRIRNERYIGNLKNIRYYELADLYTGRLNRMNELAAPDEETKPRRMFIKQSKIQLLIDKKELETEEDVDEYLKALREAMVKQIQKNRNIILD